MDREFPSRSQEQKLKKIIEPGCRSEPCFKFRKIQNQKFKSATREAFSGKHLCVPVSASSCYTFAKQCDGSGANSWPLQAFSCASFECGAARKRDKLCRGWLLFLCVAVLGSLLWLQLSERAAEMDSNRQRTCVCYPREAAVLAPMWCTFVQWQRRRVHTGLMHTTERKQSITKLE